MEDKLLSPEDFIREGQELIRKGQKLIAYGHRLAEDRDYDEASISKKQPPNHLAQAHMEQPVIDSLSKKNEIRKERKANRTPLYKDPVFMEAALHRIFKHQDNFLAKRKMRAELDLLHDKVVRKGRGGK